MFAVEAAHRSNAGVGMLALVLTHLRIVGKRIVITFGAGHKYWFLAQLRAMESVQLMDVTPYLPPAD
ncbi:MAG: hypothetical protein ACI87O_000992 [Planctomycetota bacterium]|jgi:hypothetical protein